MLAALLCAAAVLVAVVAAGRVLAPAAVASDFAQQNLPPSLEYPFGTDWMGRNMLARTLAGLSTSIVLGLASSACSCVLAFAMASLAVFGPKGADALVTWLIDLMCGMPHVILLILVSYALGRGAVGVTAAVALTHWPSLARVLRAEMNQIREQPYLQMSRALGVRGWALLRDHVLPAVLPQLVVGAILAFPHAILHEATITFLGFGLPAEEPAVGVILSESMRYLSAGYWWLAALPGASLVAVVLVFERAGALVRRAASARTAQE